MTSICTLSILLPRRYRIELCNCFAAAQLSRAASNKDCLHIGQVAGGCLSETGLSTIFAAQSLFRQVISTPLISTIWIRWRVSEVMQNSSPVLTCLTPYDSVLQGLIP